MSDKPSTIKRIVKAAIPTKEQYATAVYVEGIGAVAGTCIGVIAKTWTTQSIINAGLGGIATGAGVGAAVGLVAAMPVVAALCVKENDPATAQQAYQAGHRLGSRMRSWFTRKPKDE